MKNKYKWECKQCGAIVTSDKKQNPEKLIFQGNCNICKKLVEVKFKDLKENEKYES